MNTDITINNNYILVAAKKDPYGEGIIVNQHNFPYLKVVEEFENFEQAYQKMGHELKNNSWFNSYLYIITEDPKDWGNIIICASNDPTLPLGVA